MCKNSTQNVPIFNMAKVEEKVESLISKTIEELGYELYDVIYEKEAQDYYLRIFIDNQNGISLDDCEKVNDAITDMLDDANYIKEQYFLEVSSTGVERHLRKDRHLEKVLDQEIEVNLFSPISFGDKEELDEKDKKKKNKKKNNLGKQLAGILKGFDDEKITLLIDEKTIEIQRKNISNMKLKYNW